HQSFYPFPSTTLFRSDQLMKSFGMHRNSPRILSLTIEVLFETPFVQPSPGHSTCQSRARPGRCMPSGLALCQSQGLIPLPATVRSEEHTSELQSRVDL